MELKSALLKYQQIIVIILISISENLISAGEMEDHDSEIVGEDFEISEDIEALAKEPELDSTSKKSFEKYKSTPTFEIFERWQRLKNASTFCIQRTFKEVQTHELLEPVFDH